MKSLADLLKGRHIPGIQLSEQRQICVATLEALLHCPLKSKQVKYEDGVLQLTVVPVLRSAILLKQEELRGLLAAQGIVLREIR